MRAYLTWLWQHRSIRLLAAVVLTCALYPLYMLVRLDRSMERVTNWTTAGIAATGAKWAVVSVVMSVVMSALLSDVLTRIGAGLVPPVLAL